MIPGTRALKESSAWQRELAQAITDPAELVRFLRLDPALIEPACAVAAQFPLRVPRPYAARMRPGDVNDPLLRQVLPLVAEADIVSGYTLDPVGDASARLAPGLLQKYQGRVLLTTTGACAVNCRYCFRRHFSYSDDNPATDGWAETVARIADDESVREVILSGGDPLTLSDGRIANLLDKLAPIAHVERVRFHTRLPIVLPERITEDFCRMLAQSRFQTVVVVHANHANEIDPTVVHVLAMLRDSGITLLNQSVLLRGVNDDVETLCALSEALFAAGALPYYLHLLDRVQGAAHFDVDEAVGVDLWRAMAARLPGYLVPRLAREEVGAPAKTTIR